MLTDAMIKGIMNIARFLYNVYKDGEVLSRCFSSAIDCRLGLKTKIMGYHNLAYVVIDDYTYVAHNSNISYTQIGKYCSIGPNILCGWGIHPTNGISTSPMFYSTRKQNGFSVSQIAEFEERKEIHIGNDVFIGANVTILDGITIGDGAVIGAGSVVSKNIPPYAVAVGCPIKIVRYRFSPETVDALLKIQWWQYGEAAHAEIAHSFFKVSEFVDKFK